jgi:DNA primase
VELSELIESVDILDYISQYTEFSEKNGEFWALSPLKDEKTPSFSVRKETNSFYDFSSGIGGNVLTFIRYYNKCGYNEAVNMLTKYAGLDGKVVSQRKLSATQVAKRFSPPKKAQKPNKNTAMPDDYMERYEKMADKLAVWEREGISAASLEKFQVFYDSFSDRLVYPIRSIDGKIINVGGRTLDERWMEKGLRKYTYFKQWGELNTLYGVAENMEEIQKKREIILFEGAKSVMLADTWGIRNTGAILTSHLNPHQMRILAKLAFRVVFALDKDICVREDHNIKRLKQFVKVEYVWDRDNLLDVKDAPVDKGFDIWKELYEGRLSWR